MVDLGAAPGGWSQVAAKRVGSIDGKGQVVAIDLLAMPEIAGVDFAQLDFMDNDAPAKLTAMLGGGADVVMSDMAANATGHRKTDQLRIVGLIETAAAFACDVLKPGGTFLAKAFQGGTDAELLAQLKRDFASVRHVKPAASRAGLVGALCAGDGVPGRGEGVALGSIAGSRDRSPHGAKRNGWDSSRIALRSTRATQKCSYPSR